MKREKSRVDYIDIAKGIAILCVILGHMSFKGINSIIFSFHMPIFFILSGYFISKKHKIKELLKKLSKTLLLPYISTCFLIIFITLVRWGGYNRAL